MPLVTSAIYVLARDRGAARRAPLCRSFHDVLSRIGPGNVEKRRFARESLLVTQITLYGQT